ncbi:hypothetical protein U27_03064 [Candidatus Vecturithrix granuli]|uniref:Uncharacterized protein n=1 Tax=Vecturithrix granuli TaxID=1499967 RepID=A0A081BUU7_VECG1|nr:hypothetical protein U27_03064 [Candidatus Vecturithrix granuli]
MKTYWRIVLIGLCLIGLPITSFAALDWHIRWEETYSPQIAKVHIFNPEYTTQGFSLEIGDVAKSTEANPNAPYLIVGQDISLQLRPSERRIFDIIVYQDIDPYQLYTTGSKGKMYQLTSDNYRALGQRYGTPSSTVESSRQYPYTAQIQKIIPVGKEDDQYTGDYYNYQSGRGYWKIALTDHDYIIEQLIRTGDRLGASHRSIQEAILFYTQGNMYLSDEALEVWETAFPELRAIDVSPTPPAGDCIRFVTVVTTNLSYYSSGRTITMGDILASNDKTLAPVVAAQDLTYSVSPNTPSSKRMLRVFLMSQRGQPTSQSEYVSIIGHNTQIEQAIRIGFAENYHSCAIQDVIFYINHEVAAPTTGSGLWQRIGGVRTPVPGQPTPGGRTTLCLGNPFTSTAGQQQVSSTTTFKNLIVLLGAVIPFGLIFRRNGRK